MINCTVKIEFCAAKRLLDYDGKCNQLHGYGHKVEVSFSGNKNDDMVADFYDLKEKLNNWIDKNWDHNVILNKKDKPLGKVISDMTGQKVFYLDKDPTAENMAKYLKDKICPKIIKEAKCSKVRLYDNDSAFVEVT